MLLSVERTLVVIAWSASETDHGDGGEGRVWTSRHSKCPKNWTSGSSEELAAGDKERPTRNRSDSPSRNPELLGFL